MRAITKIAAAAAMTLSFATAGVANAATLVDVAISGLTGTNQINWNGTAANEGTVSVTNLVTVLNFDDALYNDGLLGQVAILNLTGSTNGGGTLDTDLSNFTQMGLDGTFEFRLQSDPSIVLLAGSFSDFWLTGVLSGQDANSGNLTSVGGSVELTSGVVDLSFLSKANASFSFTNVHPAYSITGGQLDDFQANNLTGSFGGVVPEPGTWALMIVGFGGAGAMIRRRRAAVLAA